MKEPEKIYIDRVTYYYVMLDAYPETTTALIKIKDDQPEYELNLPGLDLNKELIERNVRSFLKGFDAGRHFGSWEHGRNLRDFFREFKALMR